MSEDMFEKGLKVRREVLGAAYVDSSLAKADDFMMAFQRITTEWCWGYAWTRDGLNRRDRSMLNLAMLTALNRPAEIKLHVKGAIANGLSVDEIKEILLHATVYCGIPAGLDAFKAAHEVLKAEGKLEWLGRISENASSSLASAIWDGRWPRGFTPVDTGFRSMMSLRTARGPSQTRSAAASC